MMDAIYALIKWIADLIKLLWKSVTDYISDVWVEVAEEIMMAIAAVINSIPVPSFIEEYTIGHILNLMPSDILYFLGLLRLDESLAVLSAGLTFRMLRKLVTLFQW